MSEKKLNLLNEYCVYNENMQDSSIRFSPVVKVDGVYEQLWMGVSCRDKMQDYPMLSKNGGTVHPINGFSFNKPELLEYIGPRFLLLVEFSGKYEYHSFLEGYKYITELEELAGISNSFFEFNQEGVYNSHKNTYYRLIISLDPWWNKSPVLLSILTFVMRAVSYSHFSHEGSLQELIDEIYEEYSFNDNYDLDGNEDEMTRILKDEKFNLHFFIKNADRILGDNPLTGSDDTKISRRYKEHMLHYPERPFYSIMNNYIFQSKKFKDIPVEVRYCNKLQHCNLGYVSVFGSVKELIKDEPSLEEMRYYLNNVPEWIINYLEVLIENKLVNSNRFKYLYK